jgi:uncharacterized membrane protein required for colicin V production
MFGPYDVLVLAVLAVGYVAGRSKGFAWQVSGIATLVFGLIAAAAGSRVVARFFPDAWNEDVRRFAAWVAIYAVVEIAIYLVTLALSKKIKEHELDDLDKRWGGTLGAVRWGLGLGAVSIVLVAGSERAQGFVQESLSGPLLARIAIVARPLLPEKIGAALERTIQRIDPNATAPSPSPVPSRAPVRPSGPSTPPPIARRPRTPASTPVPAASPSAPDLDAPATDDDPPPPPRKPRDSGKTIEPEPEASPEPRDPLAPPPR